MSRRQRKNVKKREKDSGSLNNLVNTTSIPSTTNTTSSNTNNLTSTSVSVFTSKELLTCSSQTTTSNCKDNNSTSNPPKVQRKRNGLPSRLYVSINLSKEHITISIFALQMSRNCFFNIYFRYYCLFATYFMIQEEIRMFHPLRKVSFHEFIPIQKRNITVSCVIIFCLNYQSIIIKSMIK